MAEIVTVGEKGQIVIPKKIREFFKLHKGTKLLISEDKEKISKSTHKEVINKINELIKL